MNLPHINEILNCFSVYNGLLFSRPFTKNIFHFTITLESALNQELRVFNIVQV
jgi:hypothetical protein